jgi:hypothetical protein
VSFGDESSGRRRRSDRRRSKPRHVTFMPRRTELGELGLCDGDLGPHRVDASDLGIAARVEHGGGHRNPST